MNVLRTGNKVPSKGTEVPNGQLDDNKKVSAVHVNARHT